MSTDVNRTVIVCRGLRPAEQEKVTRLGAAITQRFATLGHAVGICQSVGEDERRLLCFLTAGEWNLGSVWSRALMEEPDDTAAGVISLWVGLHEGTPHFAALTRDSREWSTKTLI